MIKDVIYIMATGPSINNITDEEWKYLNDKPTIGITFFSLKDKEYKYHYSHGSFELDKICIDRVYKNNYMNTIFFFIQ
jgi:hypothetical protein